MDIKSMLNSPHDDSREHHDSVPLCSTSDQHRLPPVAITKRQKIAKDAPVFSEGNKIVGHVNYPPHEAGNDRDLEAHHREFRIFPLGQIRKKGVRHIPYNSDKKDFLDKTGRDAFQVFHYTYRRPGEDKEYVVVWDYNVGLVRMTPFFKSCKYSKTVPAKALRENPGMKEISYSITGGALVCQGYWMPYQAARTIAATFCWDIRWALTPVFGNDFPQICTPPQHLAFARFIIDSQIVRFCTAETTRFKEEGASYQLLPPNTSSPVIVPPRPLLSSPQWKPSGCPGDLESGYGSDVERKDEATFSPHVSPRCQFGRFTPINGVAMSNSPHTTFPTYCSSLSPPNVERAPTSVSNESYSEAFRTKRTHSKVAYSDNGSKVEKVDSPQTQLAQAPNVPCQEEPETDSRDREAAETLMALSVVGRNAAAMPIPKRTRRSSRY